MRYLIPLCAMTLGVGLTSVSPARAPAERLGRTRATFHRPGACPRSDSDLLNGVADQRSQPVRRPQPLALAVFDAQERADLDQLRAIDPTTLPPAALPTYANLKEQLESDLQLRVCRIELWNVNHFDGWLSGFAEVAQQQPVDTPAERAQAIKRWSSVTTYVEVEVANLRLGLAAGYSAPRAVVRTGYQAVRRPSLRPRLKQCRCIPPAARSCRRRLRKYFHAGADGGGSIRPLNHYREFLAQEYLPHAREGVLPFPTCPMGRVVMPPSCARAPHSNGRLRRSSIWVSAPSPRTSRRRPDSRMSCLASPTLAAPTPPAPT